MVKKSDKELEREEKKKRDTWRDRLNRRVNKLPPERRAYFDAMMRGRNAKNLTHVENALKMAQEVKLEDLKVACAYFRVTPPEKKGRVSSLIIEHKIKS